MTGHLRSAGIAAAAALLAAACGGASTPTPTPTPAPSATPIASVTPPATTAPSPTASAAVGIVYFARDRLPPVGVAVQRTSLGTTAEERILASLASLFTARAPAGLFNTTLVSKARPARVAIDMDVATVDFDVPPEGWGTAGSAGTRAFVQQIVYTASEEPGVRRVLITENGGQATIGGEGLVIDGPASREDVSGYLTPPSYAPLALGAVPAARPPELALRWSVDEVAPALVRVVVDTGLYGADAKAGLGFTIVPRPNDDTRTRDLGKWALTIDVFDAVAKDARIPVGATPLRTIATSSIGGDVRYQIGLDDLRPWRAAMLYEPLRLVVDIGGDPDGVSPNIAVYAPAFGATVGPGFTASGLIRAFEARFQYRVVAYDGAVVTSGFGMGSLGTSDLWGTFEVTVPRVPPGGGTLEILLRSPRDGSIAEQVSIPIAPGRG